MPKSKEKMKKPNSSGSPVSNKKKMKKPSSKLLGTGMARQAADAITERQKRMGKLMKELGM